MAKNFQKAFWVVWIIDAVLLVVWSVFEVKENM